MANQLKPLYNIINREQTLTNAWKRVLRRILRLAENVENVFNRTIITETGGYLVWGNAIYNGNLDFDVTACQVVIDEEPHVTQGGTVTLAAADVTNDRWDLIVADVSTSAPAVVTGTPAATALKPELDPETQVLITEILVPANASAPDIEVTNLYLNNTEWTTAGSATVDFDSPGDLPLGPFEGAKCIEFTNAQREDYLTLTTGTEVHIGDLDMLEMQVLCTAEWPANKYLRAAWYRGNARVSNWVKLTDYPSDDVFDSSNTESWQAVALSGSDFKYTDQYCDSLRIEVRGLGGGGLSFFLDRIRAHKGYQIAHRHSIAYLDREQVWKRNQAFMTPELVDAANIEWDMNRAHIATVTLTDNRTLDNPLNIKAGATYILRVKQDNVGGHTLAYGSNYRWVGGTEPTVTAAADAEDIMVFVSFDGTYVYGLSNTNYS
jgi:hypothetical protein